MATMLKMMEAEELKPEPLPQKTSAPKLKRVSSDDRFENQEYQAKEEAKMLEGMMAAIGMSKEEMAELQK